MGFYAIRFTIIQQQEVTWAFRMDLDRNTTDRILKLKGSVDWQESYTGRCKLCDAIQNND
jgi:hypothetical protein